MMVAAPVLLLTAVTSAAAWLLIIAGRGSRSGRCAGPVCGACGYSVVGLTRMTCPECGSDLRAVGIFTPRTLRPRVWSGGGVVLFTVLLGFVATVSSLAVLSILPMRYSYGRHVWLETPTSGAYQQVILGTEGAAWGPYWHMPPVEIELVPNVMVGTATNPAPREPDTPVRMTVRPNGRYEYAISGAPNVARPGGFGAAAVLDWMTAAGLDTRHATIRQEATRVATEIRAIRNALRERISGPDGARYPNDSSSGGNAPDRQFENNQFTDHAECRPPSGAGLAAALVWLAVWVCGLRHLARRAMPAPHRSAQR